MTPVTDPNVLAQLEAAPAGLKPVTDPAILAQLEEAQPKRSLAEQGARAVGRTVRAGLQGITAIPEMLTTGALNLYDLGAAGIENLTGIPQTRYSARQLKVRDALTKMGLPEAENATERVAEDVAGGMAGAGAMVKGGEALARGGNALVRRVGEVMSSGPRVQVVAGATGPGAAGIVREEGGGPVAQTVAGVTGAMAPALPEAARAIVRGLARGGEAGRQRVAQNIETFEDAGAGVPTVGQATESRVARAVESGLSKAPGGAGVMTAKAEAEALGMGKRADQIAVQLAPRSGAEPAGRAIKSGVDDFVKEFKVTSASMYDKLDKHLPKGTQVKVDSTRAALERLNADIPGAPALSKWFKNAKIQGIEGALKKDAPATTAEDIVSMILGPDGKGIVTGQTSAKAAGVPYEALKKLRTLVGDEMASPSLVSDVPRSKWKALYAALSEDLGAAAKEAGPNAERALRRANRFYGAGIKRVDDVLSPIVSKSDPEDIFKAAVSGTKEGATTIRGVMKSIPTESQKVLSATMLRRLGKATPGQQNELGETFSAETFLTNWNRITPEAKRALFNPMTPRMRRELDEIAAVAANIREGSKVFANPSGTAQAAATHMTAGAALISVLTGNFALAGGIAAGVGGSNLSARLMTNPDFVRFLAGSTRVPVEQVPAQLNQLFQQSLYLKRDERRDVREFIKQARESLRAQQGQGQQ